MPKLPDATALPRNTPRATVVTTPGRIARPIKQAANMQSAFASRAGGAFRTGSKTAVFFAQAEQRIQDRDASVDRAKKVTGFNSQAIEDLRKLQTEGDLSDQETITQYRESLEAAKNQLLTDHAFSEESQTVLDVRLEGIIGNYMGQATSLSLDAKKKAVNDSLETDLNSLVKDVYGNPSPENILQQFESARSMVANMAPALDPHEEIAWQRTFESKLVEGSVTSFIDRGNWRGAEAILYQTGVGDILSPDKRVQLFSRIGAARAADLKRRSQSQRPFVVGSKLVSPDGRVIYDGTGGISKDPFGSGLTGSELEAFTSLTPKFETGETTRDEDMVYLAAVSDYTQEKRDPETGLMQQKKVPAFVEDALRKRGYGGVLEPQEMEITRSAYQALNKRTVWEIADEGNLTGPVPIVSRFIGRIPGLGGPSPESTTAASYVNVIKRDLIRTLQNNPKFADAERKAIEKEVDIGPEFFDDKEAYKQRVVGIADGLERRLDSMNKIAASSTTSREERRWARNGINAIENFLEALLPPRVATDEDAEEFLKNNPTGTPVLVKDGEKWIEMEVP